MLALAASGAVVEGAGAARTEEDFMSVQRASPTNPRSLGLWMSTALVIGNMIASGIFLPPASLAAYGGTSIVGWLMTSLCALLLAFVFARLSRTLPKIGGPYAYSREGFGEVIGFQVAWGNWIGIWAGNAAIVTAFVGSLNDAFLERRATGQTAACGAAQ